MNCEIILKNLQSYFFINFYVHKIAKKSKKKAAKLVLVIFKKIGLVS